MQLIKKSKCSSIRARKRTARSITITSDERGTVFWLSSMDVRIKVLFNTIHTTIDFFHLMHLICCGKKKSLKMWLWSVQCEKTLDLDFVPWTRVLWKVPLCTSSMSLNCAAFLSKLLYPVILIKLPLNWSFVRYCLCYMAI